MDCLHRIYTVVPSHGSTIKWPSFYELKLTRIREHPRNHPSGEVDMYELGQSYSGV